MKKFIAVSAGILTFLFALLVFSIGEAAVGFRPQILGALGGTGYLLLRAAACFVAARWAFRKMLPGERETAAAGLEKDQVH